MCIRDRKRILSASNSSPLASSVSIITLNRLLTSEVIFNEFSNLFEKTLDEAIVFITDSLICFVDVIEIMFSLIILFCFSVLKSHLFKTIIIFFFKFDNSLMRYSSYLLIS